MGGDRAGEWDVMTTRDAVQTGSNHGPSILPVEGGEGVQAAFDEWVGWR